MSQPPNGQTPNFPPSSGQSFNAGQPNFTTPGDSGRQPEFLANDVPAQPHFEPASYPAPQPHRQPALTVPQPPEPVRQEREPTEQQWQQWAAPVNPADEQTQEAELTKLAAQGSGDPFAPAGIDFKSVSPNLTKLRLITATIWCGLGLLTVAAVLTAISLTDPAAMQGWFWLGLLPFVLLFGWLCWLIPRQVRAMGYAETDSELIIRKGILFQSLVAVPYGRLQYVDVNAGPLQRWLGMTTLQLHTASATTDANLPGIPPAEAARLRDDLSERGESQLAGL